MKKILILLQLFILLGAISIPLLALGQNNTNLTNLRAELSLPDELKPKNAPEIELETKKDGKKIPGSEADYLNYFLQLIAGGLLYLAGPTAILVIAISGLRYVTSHGEDSQMEGAKKTLEFAIIGLIVIIFSFAIVKAIIGILVTTG